MKSGLRYIAPQKCNDIEEITQKADTITGWQPLDEGHIQRIIRRFKGFLTEYEEGRRMIGDIQRIKHIY
jgi:hypothetical protein